MNMSEKDFENTLNEFTQSSEVTSDSAENTQSIEIETIENAESTAEMKTAADTIVENAAINTEAVDAEGFDAGNPQYEEHTQRSYDSEPTYSGSYSDSSYGSGSSYGSNNSYSSGSGSYGSNNSYGSGSSYAYATEKKHPGFITKRAFVVVLIIAMLFTMIASVGITTAYTTFLHQQTLSKVNTSDEHATKYELTKSDESLSFKSIIQKTQDSVVSITTESIVNDMWMQNYVTQGAGSGVIIQSDGYIITCEHVIEGARKIKVTMRDGKEYDAKIVGVDEENDIGVIKIDATGLKSATYGDSSKLEVGDTTVVIGNPLGTLSGTVTTGIISALDRKLTIDNQTYTLLQTDASINPGNSGGGMFDASGNLIGIVEAKSTGTNIDGLGFATPINKAAKIAKELIENEGKSDSGSSSSSKKSDAPMIGIMVTEVNDQVASQYGYAHGGLLVRSVTSVEAQMAGLVEGDVIYKADGKSITTQDSLSKVLSGKKSGDKLKLSVAREGGSTAELTTILVSNKDVN